MHGSFNTWPETVGIREDENNEIVVVVNSQGEQKKLYCACLGLVWIQDCQLRTRHH